MQLNATQPTAERQPRVGPIGCGSKPPVTGKKGGASGCGEGTYDRG